MTRIRIETSPLRVRAVLGSGPIEQRTVADSTSASMVFLEGRHPEYYFPVGDVSWDLLILDDESQRDVLGAFRVIRSGTTEVGHHYLDGPAGGLVRLEFRAMDAWFEEEEALFVHPRDPYVRVDVLETSRRVEVDVGGILVAASDRPRLVTETGLPPRWYLPRVDIDIALLGRSETVTSCGYKGKASYWDLMVEGERTITNVAWGYERPIISKLAGLICFYAEKDEVETRVDGELLVMPEYHPSWLNASLFIDNDTIDGDGS